MSEEFQIDIETLTRLRDQAVMAIAMIEGGMEMRELPEIQRRLPEDHFIIGDFVIRPRRPNE